MTLLSLIIFLVVVGVVLYLINMIPMDAQVKKIINILVVVVIILWLIKTLFGGSLPDIKL